MTQLKYQTTSKPGEYAANNYPFLLAYPYRLMRLESNPAESVYRIFDLLEIMIRYLGVMLCCELLKKGEFEFLIPWFEKPMSLGTIHGWLRDSQKQSKGKDESSILAFLNLLYNSGQTGKNKDFIKNIDLLIAERNRIRGHGITLSDRKYSKLRIELLDRIEGLYNALEPLEEIRPIIIKGLNNFDGSRYEHQVLIAVGDNPYFTVEVLQTNESIPFNQVFIKDHKTAELKPVYPFIVYETCKKCDEDHLFLFNVFRDKKIHYQSPQKGCLLNLKFDPQDFFQKKEKNTVHIEPEIQKDILEKVVLKEGLKLGGRYILKTELGRGSSGVIFEADDLLSQKTVAVKILNSSLYKRRRSDFLQDPKLKRFQREAVAISRISHPNIVRIIDIGADRGFDYFVMELVQGKDLREIMQAGRLNVDLAINFIKQILNGLAQVHEKGIVHRDIKPENIIITEDNTVKIADFGIAHISGMTTITSEGEIIGTIGYMAPEQIENQQIDGRADLFCLGVIFYELVAGCRPFEARSQKEEIANILTSDPVPVAKIDTQLPAWLDDVFKKMLAKSPDDRPADAEACLLLIESCRQGVFERKRDLRTYLNVLIKRKDEPDSQYFYPIEVKKLSMGFRKNNEVLSDLDLKLSKGVRYCIMGRNGAGKTTLIKCLLNLYKPDSGKIKIFKSQSWKREIHNQYIGYIPEESSAYPYMKLGYYIESLSHFYNNWDQKYVLSLVNQFNLKLNEKISTFSKGMKTMVSVLTAFGHNPPLLILDDPTVGFDAFWTKDFLDTVHDMVYQRKTTLLFTTHNFEAAESIADRIGFLQNGKITIELDMQDVIRKYRKISLTLPSDDEPKEYPHGFYIMEKKKRYITGIYQLSQIPSKDAFAVLNPVDYAETSPTLREVYYYVLSEG